MDFDGLFFGPGLPPSGQTARFTLDESGLRLPDGAHVPANALELRKAGFDERGLKLSWSSADGHKSAVHVLDGAIAAALRAALPAELQRQHRTIVARGRARSGWRALAWAAVAAFVLAPLLALLAFFAFADSLAGWGAGHISIEQETKLGDVSFDHLKSQLKLRDDSAAAIAVRDIGARLTKDSRYRYRFHVVEDKTINAFAIPGGIVVVHSGLIEATKRPEELAGVLAHEVQHVELRHSLKSLIKQLGIAVLWAVATGDIGGTVGGQAAQQLAQLKFSRDAEREADERGLDSLYDAGIDPTGMPAFFATLAKEGASAPELLSTHPHSSDRQAALNIKIAKLPKRNYTPLPATNWPPAIQ